MLHLDVCRSSVVIVCTDCSHWRGMAFTRLGAWERAATHEKLCHPGQTQAQDALSEARRKLRHAVSSPAVG